MSEFKFSCPHCDQHILIPDGYEGVQINCPACQKLIVVPPTPGAIKPPPPPAALGIQRPAAPASSSAAAPAAARTAYNPPPAPKAGSRVLRMALIISTVVVVCAVLGVGGWHFYSKHKAKVEADNSSTTEAAQSGGQQNPDSPAAAAADDILEKVALTYKGLTNFSATGTSISIFDMSGIKPSDIPGGNNAKEKKRIDAMSKVPQTNTTEVSIKLARPDLYRIDLDMKMGTVSMKNAVWSSGDGDFMFMGRRYMKLPNRRAALGISGSAGGLSSAVAQLFFGETESIVKDWAKADDDTVNDEDCYTLTGIATGQKLKIWVSKASYLILQSQVTLGGKISEADIDESIKNMGTNATPQQIAKMKAQTKQAMAMASKIKGSITETYDDIETNNVFTAETFRYPVPPDIKLSPSMF